MSNNKKYVVDTNFINVAYNLNLSLTEFLLLLYFDNADEDIFAVETIAKKLRMEVSDILFAFNNLVTKKLVSLVSEKNEDNKIYDKVLLNGFYEKYEENQKKQNKRNIKEDIFTKFENEFKRPLAGMEIEIIKAWSEKYEESLILRALEEAIYNGATNIRYIDTILYEWTKKGYKTKEDVENGLKKSYDKKLEETNILDFDWLDNYDK